MRGTCFTRKGQSGEGHLLINQRFTNAGVIIVLAFSFAKICFLPAEYELILIYLLQMYMQLQHELMLKI